ANVAGGETGALPIGGRGEEGGGGGQGGGVGGGGEGGGGRERGGGGAGGAPAGGGRHPPPRGRAEGGGGAHAAHPQPARGSTQAAQPGRPVLPASTSPLMPRARPPLAGASDARHRRRARAEAFLFHVELDGAADGRVHVGARTPSEVALRRLDVGHAHLDVLVVLAVVLAGGHIDDLGGTGVVAQHRELLCDPDGALGEIADRDAIGRVADVEYAPAGAPVLVPENGQEALDGVVDVREGAFLAAAVD